MKLLQSQAEIFFKFGEYLDEFAPKFKLLCQNHRELVPEDTSLEILLNYENDAITVPVCQWFQPGCQPAGLRNHLFGIGRQITDSSLSSDAGNMTKDQI